MSDGADRASRSLRRPLAIIGSLVVWMSFGAPVAVDAQAGTEWDFVQDPFTDVWFHGLAMLGFHGSGATPLYDAEYAWDVRSARRAAGIAETELERTRGMLLGAFSSDPAFEILHFVPLYFSGAPIGSALDALEASAVSNARWNAEVTRGAEIVNAVLTTPAQRAVLDVFVDALREEWRLVTTGVIDWRRPLPTSDFGEDWRALVDGSLSDFLEREGLSKGRVVLTATLGAEGRMLANEAGAWVVVGATLDPESSSGAVLRELCYPAVRRALAPFEARFEDRHAASKVSELAATRCGELLLEAYAPGYLEGYRSRFGVVMTDSGFLSVPGVSVGAAALEGEIERALQRELHLDSDAGRPLSRPVGR